MLHRDSITHINPSHFPFTYKHSQHRIRQRCNSTNEGKQPQHVDSNPKRTKDQPALSRGHTLPHYAANHHQTEYANGREKRSANKSQKWRKILGPSIPTSLRRIKEQTDRERVRERAHERQKAEMVSEFGSQPAYASQSPSFFPCLDPGIKSPYLQMVSEVAFHLRHLLLPRRRRRRRFLETPSPTKKLRPMI